MVILTKYRMRCETDNRWEFTYSLTTPTICPINAGHTIGSEINTLESISAVQLTENDDGYKMIAFSVLVDTSGGDTEVKPPKADESSGVRYIIKKTHASNTLTVKPKNGDINGESDYDMTALNEIILIESDGNDWNILDYYNMGVNQNGGGSSNNTLILTNKGDIAVGDGLSTSLLSVGNNTYNLEADSGATGGMIWKQPDHTNLANIGTNTHTQIDTHITASTGAHGITGAFVGTTDIQTLTNKTFNADNNTITNIDNNDIKSAAAIDATKIANGSVTNSEFQYINTLTSDVQTQINNIIQASGSVNTHSDVTLTSPSSGQVIKYNGSQWINDADNMGVIGTNGVLAIVSVRRSLGYSLTTSFANMTYNITDVETDPTIIEHDNTNTERINIKKDGYYKINYSCTQNGAGGWNYLKGKLVKNGTTDIPGSLVRGFSYVAGIYDLITGVDNEIISWLIDGDYITTQYEIQAASTTKYDSVFSVVKLDGIIGPIGPTGADGDITWESAWSSLTSYNVNEAVTYNGTSYVCILNHTDQTPPNATYWDVLAAKGDQGDQGNTGAQGNTGFIDWNGTWVSQNYTTDQTVEYNGSSYICHTDTTSSQVPTDTNYWDLVASKGDVGTPGAGSSVIIKNDNVSLTNTPHTEIDFSSGLSAIDGATGIAIISKISRVCDTYYDPVTETTVAATWVDIPMNVDRTIDSDFTHTTDSAEITFNTTDRYSIAARCSTYITVGSARSQTQMRLMEDVGSGYVQVGGSIGYMYNRLTPQGYASATVNLIKTYNNGDKIKLQSIRIAGTDIIKAASEACSITISSV